MIRRVEAVIDEQGNVRLLEPVALSAPRRAVVSFKDEQAAASRDDWILCQITSSPYADKRAVSLSQADFDEGGLRITSYARPGKLFTANRDLVVRPVGTLKPAVFLQWIDSVVTLLRAGAAH